MSLPQPADLIARYPRGVALVGRDDLRGVLTAGLRAHLAARAGGEISILTVDLKEGGIEALVREASPGLFPRPRLIHAVRGETIKKAGAGAAARAIADLTEQDFLVVEIDPEAKGSVLAESGLAAGFGVAKLDPLKGAALKTWIQSRCREAGLTAPPAVIDALAESSGGNLLTITREVEKLSLVFPDGKADPERAIPLLVDIPETDVFELLNAIIEGPRERVMRAVDDLLLAGSAPNYLLVMIASQLRVLLTARHLLDKGEKPGEAAKKLGRPPWVAEKIVRMAGKLTYPQLVSAFERLVMADLATKSSGHPPERILEEALFSLFSRSGSGYSYFNSLQAGEDL